MAELKANNQKPNFDNNPKLIEAIAEMRKNFCAETQNKVISTCLHISRACNGRKDNRACCRR